jgi:hypothetical protein
LILLSFGGVLYLLVVGAAVDIGISVFMSNFKEPVHALIVVTTSFAGTSALAFS